MKLYFIKIIWDNDILDLFEPILKAKRFTEYRCIDYDGRGLFLRVPNSIQPGDNVRCYLEPQINLSRSMEDFKHVYKMQITIIQDKLMSYGYSSISGVDISEMPLGKFFDEIVTGCQEEKIRELFHLSKDLFDTV